MPNYNSETTHHWNMLQIAWIAQRLQQPLSIVHSMPSSSNHSTNGSQPKTSCIPNVSSLCHLAVTKERNSRLHDMIEVH